MKKVSSPKPAVFERYAGLYDLFYAEKDYQKESTYVLRFLTKHLGRRPRTILDLGCGTGGHAFVWSSKGIRVTGVDRSEEMLLHARRKAKQKGSPARFLRADVRKLSLGKKFDAVTAMFAVMSYQTSRRDIVSTLRCVRNHLRAGGIFFFDSWFGPGVLTDPPGDRVKSFTRDGMEILRTVQSTHRVDEQLVEVHYDILVLEGDRLVERVREVHPMHYYFPREVADLAAATGFELVESHPFLSEGESLRVGDWNATFVLKAR